jgi:hypothetical protein
VLWSPCIPALWFETRMQKVPHAALKYLRMWCAEYKSWRVLTMQLSMREHCRTRHLAVVQIAMHCVGWYHIDIPERLSRELRCAQKKRESSKHGCFTNFLIKTLFFSVNTELVKLYFSYTLSYAAILQILWLQFSEFLIRSFYWSSLQFTPQVSVYTERHTRHQTY